MANCGERVGEVAAEREPETGAELLVLRTDGLTVREGRIPSKTEG